METFLTTRIDQIPWFDWLKENMIVFKESISLSYPIIKLSN